MTAIEFYLPLAVPFAFVGGWGIAMLTGIAFMRAR